MYPYAYYPTHCLSACYGMTREIVERLLIEGELFGLANLAVK